MSLSEPFSVNSSQVLRPGLMVCSEHIIIILNDSDYLSLGGWEQNLEDFLCLRPSSDAKLFMS